MSFFGSFLGSQSIQYSTKSMNDNSNFEMFLVVFPGEKLMPHYKNIDSIWRFEFQKFLFYNWKL